jgi:hypothetical protein
MSQASDLLSILEGMEKWCVNLDAKGNCTTGCKAKPGKDHDPVKKGEPCPFAHAKDVRGKPHKWYDTQKCSCVVTK